MSDSAYPFLDRLLHRLVLHYPFIARASFDLDQNMAKCDPDAIRNERHVFVSGLARAGTTVLMRRFYASGAYRSLTYRDMPFILAPNFWRRVNAGSRKKTALAERAHGDRLLIDADSPESFDEVFWRVFCGSTYLHKTRLTPHHPDEETIETYVSYVSAVLAAAESPRARYLCKNNNTILRLPAIAAAFPNAVILVPFREPLSHATSLLHQHRRFSELQAKDPFMLSYMTWLGHHEFGLGHRPFRFDDHAQAHGSPDRLDYWIDLWCAAYEWLEVSKPEQALFVSYDDLCTNETVWPRLAERAGIPAEAPESERLALSTRPADLPFDEALGKRAYEIHDRLLDSARGRLA